MKAANSDWLCPICSLKLCAFGTMPCDSTCPNRKHAHITGKWYLAPNEGSDGKPVGSIGIAAISDEQQGGNDGK